jgi:pyrroline-5-carboxylate reductase
MSEAILLVGAGHMGGAILQGLLKAKPKPRLKVVDTSALRRKEVSALGVEAAGRINLIPDDETVILALPPQCFVDFASDASVLKKHRGLIVSVMAGIHIETIRHILNADNIVRAIPNTPAEVCESISVFCAAKCISPVALKRATEVLAKIGIALQVQEERFLDLATALCGGGPAYLCYLADCLQHFAVNAGIDPVQAVIMVNQLFQGTSALLALPGRQPQQLCRDVMTPGGTTVRAVEVFEKHDLKAIIFEALSSAAAHSNALGSSVKEIENARHR